MLRKYLTVPSTPSSLVKFALREATALGNLLVQARASGVVGDSLSEMRFVVSQSVASITLNPEGKKTDWQQAAARIFSKER